MMEKEEEIIAKARDLFMTYGLRSITMNDLAKELGISKKTLYQFFKDKADLINKIVRAEFIRMMKRVEEIFKIEGNAIDKMMLINRHIVNMRKNTPKNVQFDLEKYYPEISKEIKTFSEQKMFEAIKNNHDKGKKEGLIREDLDTNVIAHLQVCRSNYIDKITEILTDYEFEQILNEVFDYHIRGIATDKGLKYYLENYKNKKK